MLFAMIKLSNPDSPAGAQSATINPPASGAKLPALSPEPPATNQTEAQAHREILPATTPPAPLVLIALPSLAPTILPSRWSQRYRFRARHQQPLDSRIHVAQTTRTLRIPNFTGAVPGLNLRRDPLRDGATARLPNFLPDHRFRETEAVTDRHRVLAFLQTHSDPHILFLQPVTVRVKVNHLARSRLAKAEPWLIHQAKKFGFYHLLERQRRDRFA